MRQPQAPAGPPRPFPTAVGIVLAAAAAVVALWFLHQIIIAVLLLFFAMVVAIALSAPVGWFARRGVPRHWAAILTLVLFFAAIALIGWLVIPRLVQQIVLLANNLPGFVARIEDQLATLLARHPDLQQIIRVDGGGEDFVPGAVDIFRGVGLFSLTLLGGLALAIIFFSTVAYVVLDPVPILKGYIGSLPRASRRAGMRAYRRAESRELPQRCRSRLQRSGNRAQRCGALRLRSRILRRRSSIRGQR